MNAVEIEQAISALAEQPFDAGEFPFAFLQAFGNKETTLKRLRKGESNKSDLGGVLQTNNVHIVVAPFGHVTRTLAALKASPATAKAKAKFVLATDGDAFEAEELISGETVACTYADFPNHFGFFLPLAGITTIKQIRESSFDIRATSRLNRLYVELLRDNPDWDAAARRPDMNHFMARLIFCFFAEDTDIFNGIGLFTATVEQMSARDASNTHEVIAELFRAMNTPIAARASSGLRPWADAFPYVNGGLFSGSTEVPRFSRIARSYLLHIGHLDWRHINPDIFGSMIQAVADDEERGALGMHYTSVPNILKVLNPLFLDELRARLEEAGTNGRKLLNLRARLFRIRVFDPACGSGNFLVIAYKQLRAIEHEINTRRGEAGRRSDIPLTNFRGIELRDFPAEIARLALIIAEYQCDVLHCGQKEALAAFLPLDAENWIVCGNALRLDWLGICPPIGTGVKHHADDLFHTPLDQAQIDFENEGGETYICGNPPYKGATEQNELQKDDMASVFDGYIDNWKSFDYILGFFRKARLFMSDCNAAASFVTTNSICQGEQVYRFWPSCIYDEVKISFAVTSFRWKNLASQNAGVSVCIVGLARAPKTAILISGLTGEARRVENINAYLVGYQDVYIKNETSPINGMDQVVNGSKPADGGGLVFGADIASLLRSAAPEHKSVIRPFFGAHDATHGSSRYCIWASKTEYKDLREIEAYQARFTIVQDMRSKSEKPLTKAGSTIPFAFQQIRQEGNEVVFQIPRHSSEAREYFPAIVLPRGAIVGDGAFSFFDPSLWNIAVFVSRLSLIWIRAVCGRIKTDYRFSNTLGWNTFPVPILTDKNKDDLTSCAEGILLAREAHFPGTIADLYDPGKMPTDLREAHERNDEVLERIYIGRRFRNDTERLEKLFELYTKMTVGQGAVPKRKAEGTRVTNEAKSVPSVSVSYARTGRSTKANTLGMRPMQERAYERRGEQYLLIKSPPASGKSRALMFVALDKLHNQGLRQAIIVVPERAIGASFHDEELTRHGFWADWRVEPRWNLCDAPGSDNGGKVAAVGVFLASEDKVLVCTHATFRFAVDRLGVEAFDDRLIAVDEFHHVSANPDNKLGLHLSQFITRGRTHIVAMTGSYFRGDAEAVLAPQDEAKFDTVTYTYYEQLNGYEYLKQLDIGYFFYAESYADDILKVLDPAEKTIIHIPSVNSRESTKDKVREVEHVIEALGTWQGTDPATGFQLVRTPDGPHPAHRRPGRRRPGQARQGVGRAERARREETATTWTSSSRSAWRRRASTGSGASTR